MKFLEAAEIIISIAESPIPLGSLPATKSSCWTWAMAAITAHPCAGVSWAVEWEGRGWCPRVTIQNCHVAMSALPLLQCLYS